MGENGKMDHNTKRFSGLAVACCALITGLSTADARAETAPIAAYGHVAPVENPANAPDPRLDYKVVMSVTKAGEAGAPPMALEKAARLVNLLAVSGVPADHRHLVVILHGPATFAVLNEAGSKAHGRPPNRSADLIANLTAAGVKVDVCGQALAGLKIGRDEVLPQVQVDLSALTTIATLQLKGYALIPD